MSEEIKRIIVECKASEVENIKSNLNLLENEDRRDEIIRVPLDIVVCSENFKELAELTDKGEIKDWWFEEENTDKEVPEVEKPETLNNINLCTPTHPGKYTGSLLDAFLEIEAAWFVYNNSPAIKIGTELWYYRVQTQLECLPIVNIKEIPEWNLEEMKKIPLDKFWENALGDVIHSAIKNQHEPKTLNDLIFNVYGELLII